MIKKKITLILTICMVVVMLFPTIVFGIIDNVIGSINPSLGSGHGANMESSASKIISVVQFIAVAVTFSMLVYLGIKYTLSAANERADVKNASIKFLIGAIIVFASSTLIDVVYSVMNEIANAT